MVGENMTAFFEKLADGFMKLLSSFQWYDALDILFVTLVLYYCMKLFIRTRAVHLVRGFVFLAVIYLVVSTLHMSTSTFVFNRLFGDIVIVMILLFQPEFRHAVESFGRGDFRKFTLFSRNSTLMLEEYRSGISSIVKAAMNMSDTRTGALIVIEGKSPLTEVISTGSEIDAKISVPLIENVFYPKSPLHDGAMIIRDNRICAAGCILPLTQKEIGRELGTRHRAAVGISEATDAIVIVVSEETGAVSIARQGTLTQGVTSGVVSEQLTEFLLADDEDGRINVKGRGGKHHEEK